MNLYRAFYISIFKFLKPDYLIVLKVVSKQFKLWVDQHLDIIGHNKKINFGKFAEYSNIKLLDYMIENYPPNRSIYYHIAKKADLDCLKYLYSKECGSKLSLSIGASKNKDDSTERLQWLKEKGHIIIGLNGAIRKNNKKIVEWHLNNICQWNAIYFQYALRNLDMLKYLKNMGLNWDNDSITIAVKNGTIEVVEWLLNYDFQIPNLIDYATENENESINVIKLLKSKGFEYTHETFINAAIGENNYLLEWLKNDNCPIDYQYLLDNIEYLSDVGKKWVIDNNI